MNQQFPDNPPITEVADVAIEHGHEDVLEAFARIGRSTAVSVPEPRWHRPGIRKPRDCSRCVVITPGGDERVLEYRILDHWSIPGDPMSQVHYEPVFWRYED